MLQSEMNLKFNFNLNVRKGKMEGYNTRQKNIIYEYISKNKDRHYTVDELCSLLNNDNFKVGKTTVYRFLENLCDKGIVKKYKIDDSSSACYQYLNEDCKEHYHLKCIGCGELIHTDCKLLSEMSKHFYDEHSFMIDNSKTVLYGRCSHCMED